MAIGNGLRFLFSIESVSDYTGFSLGRFDCNIVIHREHSLSNVSICVLWVMLRFGRWNSIDGSTSLIDSWRQPINKRKIDT